MKEEILKRKTYSERKEKKENGREVEKGKQEGGKALWKKESRKEEERNKGRRERKKASSLKR